MMMVGGSRRVGERGKGKGRRGREWRVDGIGLRDGPTIIGKNACSQVVVEAEVFIFETYGCDYR